MKFSKRSALLVTCISLIGVSEALAGNYKHLLNKSVFVRDPVIACKGVDALRTYRINGENGNVMMQAQIRRSGTCVETKRASNLIITSVEEYEPGRSDLLIVEIKYATDKTAHTHYYTIMEN